MTDYAELIRDALSYDPRPDFGPENIADMLADGRGQLWTSANSVAITEDGPEGSLHVSVAAGNMDELMEDLLPQVLAHKEKNGYNRLTGYGRFGWLKVLKAKGVEPLGVYFEFGG